jgi:hypothetical protein
MIRVMILRLCCVLCASLLAATCAFAKPALSVGGRVIDGRGHVVANATVTLSSATAANVLLLSCLSSLQGAFHLPAQPPGNYILNVQAQGFLPVTRALHLALAANELTLQLSPRPVREDSVAVTADLNDLDVLSPDPAEKVFVRQDLLDANPGRPGAPVSIPGYPIETASSGIKAPQYFAPGVAGDHGEPIAQFIAVGTYLLPNNLSANAHGNGYADPNLLIPEILQSVEVNGGAFNVLEGNHSVNLAAIYGLRSHLDRFLTLTGDDRDVDLVGGISPTPQSFIALEGSFGNGFLRRLEHRQQYKLNTQRTFHLGQNDLTLLGIAYWGVSYVPGLVPIAATNAYDASYPAISHTDDTIDPRQHDQTHTALLAANDVLTLSAQQQLQISGFFRTYNLSLYSNFGQGLIRQSEFRTFLGQSTDYLNRFSRAFSLLAGLGYEREAPRRDNLDHYDLYAPGNSSYGPFTPVDSNNLTIGSITPYAAGAGSLGPLLRYYAGWRRDQIDFNNQDLLHPANSFQKWVGVNSPKATLSFAPKPSWFLPLVSASFGQSFFTEDPRIGIGSGTAAGSTAGTPVATAHSYQLVVSKTIQKTDLKLTLGHVTTSQELGKIDPDTGLQQDQGPGRLRFLTAAVRHTFSQGSVLVTFSKADARDLDSGQPTPEAPRTLFDTLANTRRLPFRLQGRAEFEYVGRKPLGTGCAPNFFAQCVGTSVREFRGELVRSFLDERLDLGVNTLIASGYTGQTIENFYPSDVQEVVGVRIPSYASVSVTYRFPARPAR